MKVARLSTSGVVLYNVRFVPYTLTCALSGEKQSFRILLRIAHCSFVCLRVCAKCIKIVGTGHTKRMVRMYVLTLKI